MLPEGAARLGAAGYVPDYGYAVRGYFYSSITFCARSLSGPALVLYDIFIAVYANPVPPDVD